MSIIGVGACQRVRHTHVIANFPKGEQGHVCVGLFDTHLDRRYDGHVPHPNGGDLVSTGSEDCQPHAEIPVISLNAGKNKQMTTSTTLSLPK